jgi:2-polyprenyl-3-methyl-5-hydroxy-6-metoxy-1,4-benzoquinol methylase
LPSPEKLATEIARGFRGSRNDHTPYIAILKSLGATGGSRVFDYGCSWGYGSWQMAAEGFEVTAYEISRPRAAYAAKELGVRLSEMNRETPASYDFFFSAHVIEHVPSPAQMLKDGMRLLKPGGVFLAITPNGSDAFRKLKGASWSSLWGNVHPQLISDEWILQATAHPCFISALPIDLPTMAAWRSERIVSGNLAGWELAFAVRKC